MRATNPLSGREIRQVIAATVRVELARAQVSGTQMAQRIGVAPSSFSRRMTGEVSFCAEEIVAIAVQLGIPTQALLANATSTAPATVGAS